MIFRGMGGEQNRKKGGQNKIKNVDKKWTKKDIKMRKIGHKRGQKME